MLRKLLKGALSALVILALFSGGAQAKFGKGGLVLTGFFPAGHWIASPTGQSLTPIFPISAAASTARQSWAYWDGTNDIPYDLAIGVNFGAFPYVFTLLSGPPGMTIEQPIYTTFQNVQYGRILWHPQGNISSNWSGTVSVQVTDQQLNSVTLSWPLSTDDTTTHFVFVSPSGSGTTCSFSVPCSLTQAFGPTFASTSYPGAIAYAESGTYSSNAASFTGTISGSTLTVSGVTGTIAIGQNISGPGNTVGAGGITEGTTIISGSGTTWTLSNSTSTASGVTIYASNDLPAYTDTDTGSGANGFEAYATRKPNALIGIPGATVTLDATQNCPTTPCYSGSNNYPNLIQSGSHAPDWYMENITPNGYNASAFERLIVLGNSQRMTFDQVVWTNGGYGTGTNNNTSMFYSAATQTQKQYLFLTDWGETGRESGTVSNNYGGFVFFSYSYVLDQRGTENSPGSNLDACFYFKGDTSYSEIRENYATANCTHAFDFGIVQFSGIFTNESAYNLGTSVKAIILGDSPSKFTWGNIGIYRNTILAGANAGVTNGQTTHNLEGPGNGATSGPVSAANSATAGSLVSSTQYTWGVTSTGVTGESSTTIGGSNGDSSTGIGGGSSNQVALTLGATTTSATLTWLPEMGAVTYNAYRELTSCGGGAGCWTEYTNVTSPWTDTGSAGTAQDPPAVPGNAVSTSRFYYYANAFATTNATTPPPTGATVVTTGTGIQNNLVDAVSGGSTICVTVPATGCPTGTQVGALNSSQSAILGKVGYQIQ